MQRLRKIVLAFGTHRLVIYALMALLFAVEWLLFVVQTGGRISLTSTIQALLCGLTIFSPLLITNYRWRWILLPIIWISALYIFANAIYFRFFGNTIPVAAYSLAGTIGSLVIHSVMAALRWADTTYLFIPAAMTALCFIRPTSTFEKKISRRFFWYAVFFAIITGILCQILYVRIQHVVWKEMRPDTSLKTVLSNSYDINYNQGIDKLHDMGLPFYLPWSFLSEWAKGERHVDLSVEQTTEITDFLTRKEVYKLPAELTFSHNKDKSLIFIIVESLNSWMADYHIGNFYLMPNLRQLIAADGTIANLSMYSQAGYGWSSDGQFIYNTGMLPSRDCVTVETYAENSFRTLAKTLSGYHSVEVICEDPKVWNHNLTTKSYGYDRLYAEKDIIAAGHDFKKEGYDMALMAYCANLASTLPQPFFMEMTTLSMHSPFPIFGFSVPSPIADNPKLSDMEKKYLANAWYFDRSLGEFISDLKNSGIYDNTVIVIASDHKYNVDSIGSLEETGEIVFCALNTGHTLNLNKVSGQIDLFPTILDIMDVRDGWRGIGVSMLRNAPSVMTGFQGETRGDLSTDTLGIARDGWHISDLMLRGNFFNTPHQKK